MHAFESAPVNSSCHLLLRFCKIATLFGSRLGLYLQLGWVVEGPPFVNGVHLTSHPTANWRGDRVTDIQQSPGRLVTGVLPLLNPSEFLIGRPKNPTPLFSPFELKCNVLS